MAIEGAIAAGDAGYRDFSYGTTTSAPTAKDQQSKLWFNDGSWWGSLFNRSTLKFHIHRLDSGTQAWSDTGVVIDERDGARGDALWDGSRLYVVTHGISETGSGSGARLNRYSYDAGAKTYARDAGFPVALTTYGASAFTIAKDSTGTVWATYAQGGKVYVTHTRASDTDWTTPYLIGTTNSTNLIPGEDESAVVAYDGDKIGVMYSNQNIHAYYFAIHKDGDPGTAWQSTTAHAAPEEADNHINVKALAPGDPAGKLVVAAKTSLNAADAPLYYALVLKQDGTWAKHVFGTVADNHTRAQIAVDADNRQVYMFATSPCCSGGSIYYKKASLDAISFPAGLGTALIQKSTDTHINNPSTTKQLLTNASELVAVAGDDTSDYYLHGTIDIGPDTTAPDTTITSGPSGTATTSSATFEFSANEPGASFECRLDGGAFAACTSPKAYSGLADGTRTFDVRATDAAGNVDATPATRTWTIDTSTQTLEFAANADAHVDETKPTTNFGSLATMEVDDSPNTEGYVRFAVTNVRGTVLNAKLRLYASNGSNNGPALYKSSATWGETTLTWSTRPAVESGMIEDKAAISTKTWVEYDVTKIVTADGTYSFKLDPTSTDGADFVTRESSNANKPQLVLVVDSDATAPETTIDSGPTGLTKSSSASFSFSANETGSTFECALDTGAFAACTSPRSYTALADGKHTFSVRAIDPTGNVDATPAIRTWTVDATAPAAPAITAPIDGAVTNSSTVTVAGTAEPFASVDVRDGAQTVATATAASTGAWTTTLNAVTDGAHAYSATATDAAGNTSASSTVVKVTVDAAAPQTVIDSGPTAATKATSASFAFSSDDPGATFACSLDGSTFASCTSPKAYAALTEGSHTFRVRAVDAASNADATPAERTWTVDATAPGAPAIVEPADGAATSSATVTVAGTAEAGAAVEVFADAASKATVTADGTGAWRVEVSGLTDGERALTARATDAAGNTSAESTARTLTIDRNAPETSIDDGPTGTSSSTTATFAFASTDPGSSFECRVDTAAFASCTSPHTVSGLADGAHAFEVRSTDRAGNVDATPATRSWTVDATIPIVTAVAPADGATGVLASANVEATFSEAMDATTLSSSTFTLTQTATGATVAATVSYDQATRKATLNPGQALKASATYTARLVGGAAGVRDAAATPMAADTTWAFVIEDAPDTVAPETRIDDGPTGTTRSTSATFAFSSDEAGSRFECRLDGGLYIACTSPHTVTGLGDGSHTFRVVATDAAGNDDSTPAVATWSVDSTPPSAPAITAPADGSSTRFRTISVSGTADTGSSIQLLDGGSPVGTATVDALGRWSAALTDVADGAHVYTATATDAAGNVSAASSSRTVTVDATAPETTLQSGPEGPTPSTSATFAFSANEAATFQCSLDGGVFATCTSPRTYENLGQGPHTLAVRAADAAGNTETTPAQRTWTVDTAAPAAPVLAAPVHASTNTTGALTVAGTAEAGSTVTVLDGANSVGTTSADAAGSWTVTLNGVGDGAHTYTAKATDAAGNASPPSNAATVTVDASAPETSIDAGPSGVTASTSATFAFSSSEAGATFQCSLDGSAFTACTSPQQYTGLAEAAHTFQVRGIDAHGNTDVTPATRSWTVSLALFADGFESGNFSAWTTMLTGADGTATVQSETKRSGSFAARLSETAAAGSFAYVRKSLDPARTELTAKGSFLVSQEGVAGGNVPLLRLFDTAGARVVSLYRQNLDADKIRITHSGSGVTTSGRLPLNTWGRFELRVIVAGATSTIEVRQDGSLIYQTTTASLGTNPIQVIQIGNETRSQTFALVADDVVVTQ